ncbi:MAG: sensor histidine kinase [Sciscionella sp.]
MAHDELEANTTQWPQWLNGRQEHARRSARRGVFGAAIFLFFLISPVSDAFSSPHSPAYRTFMLTDVLVYAVSYPFVLWFGASASHRLRIVLVAWMFLLGSCIAVIAMDAEQLIFLTYAIVTALMLLPVRWGRVIGLATVGVQILAELLTTGTIRWDNVWTLGLLTIGMSSFFHLLNTIGLLRAARQDVAELAVAEERSRLARDLHDVLGHSLTTITLKTGLARRLLESGAERDKAIAEVQDAEQLSRQALAEIRATISGYRRASLVAETVGARAALQAAEISADLPRAVDDVRADLQEPFAYVLREGVTNVIRHSGATRCTVRLGASWLEIRDNGGGHMSTVDAAAACSGGHGLSGLAERLRAVGGRIEAGPMPNGGFRLRASAPDNAPRPEPATGSVAGQITGSVTGSTVERPAAQPVETR